MSVQVLLPDGTATTIQAESGDRIEAVRVLIQAQSDIPPEQQRILLDGQVLRDGLTLADYGVSGGATLTLSYAFLSESSVEGAGGGVASGGPYAIMDTVGQSLAGPGAAEEPAADLGFWPLLFSAPVVPSRLMAVRSGQTSSVAVAKLLARVRDDDLDGFGLGGFVGLSDQGGSVTLSGGLILYSAPEFWTGTDRFTYTVVDAGGDASVGIVHVTVLPGATANLVSAVLSPGPPPTIEVRFVGIPGATYQVQASTDLRSWTTVAGSETTIPTSGPQVGRGSFVDVAAGDSRYYRTRFVSGP